VKNVGDAALDAILMEREEQGKFRSLYDFCRRVDTRKVNRRVIESLIKCGAFDFSKVYRSQMLTVLDEVLEYAQLAQRKRGEAQLSMWTSAQEEGTETYPELDEFPENQLNAFEKETIGFYISRHPLSRYQEVIKEVTDQDTSTLSTRKNNEEVTICGLVSSLKEIVTKKGDRMAFLNLEDMKGFVEVILFPEVFKASLPCLRGGDPIIIRGTLDLAEDHVKIKATEIRSLSEGSPASARTLHLKIPVASLTKSQLEELKEVLLANRGTLKVFLHLTDGGKGETIIALSDQYRVDPSPSFRRHLQTLLKSSVLSVE
jgi:DNA polymerase-3 subunit alpha